MAEGRWTKEEDARLIEIARTGSRADAVRELGRKMLSVKQRARRLGIRFAARALGGKHKGKVVRNWSRAEDKALELMVADHSYEQIARELGRTRDAITCRVAVLGLDVARGKHTLVEVAAFLGVSDATVANYRARLRKRWRIKNGAWPGLEAEDVAELASAILAEPKSQVATSAARLRAIARGELSL